MSKITDFLASVKLTIVILVLLAATSIIGTVIPQQESYQDYARYYGEQNRCAVLQAVCHRHVPGPLVLCFCWRCWR